MVRLIRKNLKGSALVCAIFAPLLIFIEVLMDLQQPTLMSDIVDIGVKGRNLGYVWSTGIKMVLCAFVGVLGGASCGVLASFASVTMAGEVRGKLFRKIQSLSCSGADSFRASSLITRLTNDVTQIQNMFLMLLRGMVRSPMLCIGGILMSFLLSPRLAVVFCVILPVLITCIVYVVRKSVPLYTEMQSWLDRVNTVMRENLLGVRVVKSFHLEGRQYERFQDVNGKFTEKSIRAQGLTFSLMPIVTLLMNLTVVAILWFGGNMVTAGGLETGKLMAFVNYLVQITNSLMFLVNLIINISRAQASAARINEVFFCREDEKESRTPRIPESFGIEFRNVSFRYRESGRYVLRDLSFRIREGQTVGIIGATGSGKSTLVSLIPRLYEADKGRVLIGGCDVRDIPLPVLRGLIRFVFQNSVLFEGTVEDNLRFGRETASKAEMEDALRTAQAWDFIQALPGGLQSRVEQRGKNFSGGQKQRLSIARTLLRKPKILILDDSTSALDLATEARLQSELSRKREKDSTVLLIAQRISSIMNADTILVLDNGRIAEQGTHSGLLRENGIYRSIAVSQLGEEALSHAAE